MNDVARREQIEIVARATVKGFEPDNIDRLKAAAALDALLADGFTVARLERVGQGHPMFMRFGKPLTYDCDWDLDGSRVVKNMKGVPMSQETLDAQGFEPVYRIVSESPASVPDRRTQ